LFERLKPEYSFALGAIREINSMKTSSLFLSLFLALAAAPAFGNSVTLYAPAPNSGGLSSDWGILASCSCFGGYWQNSAVNGKYYGDLISQGDFELLGSEGGGHYASGSFFALYVGVGTVQGTLPNAYFNSSTDVVTAAFDGQVVYYGSSTSVSGTFVGDLNPNGTLGELHISTQNGPNINFATPEPGTFAMMATGLCGLIGVVRRKLQKG
jgi:PEP-CTERM motif